MARPKQGFNKYKIINDEYVEFYVESGKWGNFVGYADLDDLDRLIEFGHTWHIRDGGGGRPCLQTCIYGRDEDGKYKIIKQPYMARWILGFEDYDYVVHHINHDPYDNRKDNLKIIPNDCNLKCRKGKNKNNTSGHRNISFDKRTNEWLVQLRDNGKTKCWRFPYDKLDEAVKFKIEKRRELYGEFTGED
jgi:hypothetical protein